MTSFKSEIQVDAGSIVLPKGPAIGFKVDEANPTFPWRDIEGLIYTDTANPSTAPAVGLFRTGIYSWNYQNGDYCHFSFHMPHDWAVGTDLFIHVHWAHNATGVAANTLGFNFTVSFAKGHNQEVFSAPVTPSITYPLVNIATSPQYQHNVTEVQLSAASPTATQLDTDNLEVDGLIIGTMTMSIPANSFTGGTPDEAVYIFTIDLHYQSTGIGTKNRTPNFYT